MRTPKMRIIRTIALDQLENYATRLFRKRERFTAKKDCSLCYEVVSKYETEPWNIRGIELASLLDEVIIHGKVYGVSIAYNPFLVLLRGGEFATCIVGEEDQTVNFYVDDAFMVHLSDETKQFVLAHELGHIQCDHAYSNKRFAYREVQADAYAAEFTGLDAIPCLMEMMGWLIELNPQIITFEDEFEARMEAMADQEAALKERARRLFHFR